eukprot:Hpha_TRINITY_DN17103_c0_g1::TRINITY_DN17103_c0_g1_i1::g.146705::m.146705
MKEVLLLFSVLVITPPGDAQEQIGPAAGGACFDRIASNTSQIAGLDIGDLCDALPYAKVHSTGNASGALDYLNNQLLPVLNSVSASTQCKNLVIRGACSAGVPACTTQGDAIQVCADGPDGICAEIETVCADEISRLAPDKKPLLQCENFPGVYSPICSAFVINVTKFGEPCVKTATILGNNPIEGFLGDGAGSYCPREGPRENLDPNTTQKDLIEEIDTWVPVPFQPGVSKVLVWVMWPASVITCIILAHLANQMQRQSQKAADAATGSKISIRSCTQITLILLVWIASFLMFLLAQWIADSNITSSFSNANQAQKLTFESADKNTQLLTQQIFDAVGNSFTGQVRSYFETFTVAHNSTIQFMQRGNLDPIDNSSVIMSQMLSTVEGSPLLQKMTISLHISHLTDNAKLLEMMSRVNTSGQMDGGCGTSRDEQGIARCEPVCRQGANVVCFQTSHLLNKMTIAVPRHVTEDILGDTVSLTLAKLGLPPDGYRAWGFELSPHQKYLNTDEPVRRDTWIYGMDGAPIPETRCESPLSLAAPCGEASDVLFATSPEYMRPFISGLWVFMGMLMIDMHVNWWYHNTGLKYPFSPRGWDHVFPVAMISRGLKLDDISDILRGLLQFGAQRLVLIENSTAGYFLAASHGAVSMKGGLRPATDAADSIVKSLLQSVAQSTNETICMTNPSFMGCSFDGYNRPWPGTKTGQVETRYDIRMTPYYVMALPFEYLNLQGVAFNMIPVFEIEEDVVLTTHQLHKDLDTNFTQVNHNYMEGQKFMVIVSIGIIIAAAFVSYLIAATIARPLTEMLKDMRDVANFRVEAVVRRYTSGEKREGRRSFFTEINAMQAYFYTMVKQLAELKKFMPDTALEQDDTSSFVSGRSGSSLRSGDSGSFAGSDEGEDNALAQRTVSVDVAYVDKRGVTEGMTKGNSLMRTQSTRGLQASLKQGEVVKRQGKFVYHYTEGQVTLYDFLKQARHCVELPVAEPLDSTARIEHGYDDHMDDDDDDDVNAASPKQVISPLKENNVEEMPIHDSRGLNHALELSGDKLSIVVRKRRKMNPLPIGMSIWSVIAKTSKVLFLLKMIDPAQTTTINRIGYIFGVIIIGGMFLNLVIAFRFNRQAMHLSPGMEEWLSNYVKEVTVGLVVASFDIQNLDILYCGLRIGGALRFFAPMPSALKHQIVRLSMISLVTSQLLPLLIHFWYFDEAEDVPFTFILSLAFTVIAIFVSGVKKCVVFCLVDSDAHKSSEFKVKEKKATLKKKTVTVLRVAIHDFGRIQELIPTTAELTEVCNAFYDQTLHIIKANKGNVTVLEAGRVEAVFNAPSTLPLHETFASRAASALAQLKLPQQVVWDRQVMGPFKCICAIVYGSFLTGNLGSLKRKSFHYISTQADFLPVLLQLADKLGASCLMNSNAAERLKERELENNQDWGIIRPVEIVVPPGEREASTVHELVSTLGSDERAKATLAAQLQDFCTSFDQLEQGEFQDARDYLNEYIANAASEGRQDHVANHLRDRLNAALSGRRLPTIETFAMGGNLMDTCFTARSQTQLSNDLGDGLEGSSKVTFNFDSPGRQRLLQRKASMPAPPPRDSVRQAPTPSYDESMWDLPDQLFGYGLHPDIEAKIAQKQQAVSRRESRAIFNADQSVLSENGPPGGLFLPTGPSGGQNSGEPLLSPVAAEWSFNGPLAASAHQDMLRSPSNVAMSPHHTAPSP